MKLVRTLMIYLHTKIQKVYARFEVFTAVKIQVEVFWVVTV